MREVLRRIRKVDRQVEDHKKEREEKNDLS